MVVLAPNVPLNYKLLAQSFLDTQSRSCGFGKFLEIQRFFSDFFVAKRERYLTSLSWSYISKMERNISHFHSLL